jgi:hypothetical protein
MLRQVIFEQKSPLDKNTPPNYIVSDSLSYVVSAILAPCPYPPSSMRLGLSLSVINSFLMTISTFLTLSLISL